MTYEELRQEFSNQTFREELIKSVGCTCVNCGSEENIEYHHIVPLVNGGTNRFSNIVPLCVECHYKAHGKVVPRNGYTGGRPKVKTLEEAKPILDRFYALEIGKAEALELLNIGKTTFARLWNEYKVTYNVPRKFRNNVDLKTAKNK